MAHLRVALDHADEVAAAAEDGWDGGSVGSHFVWVVPVMEGGKSSACVSNSTKDEGGVVRGRTTDRIRT